MPDELFRREARLKRIQEAKEELEREAADARAETLRENAAGQRAKAADESVDPVERARSATRAAKAEEEANALSAKAPDDDDDDDPGGTASTPSDLPKHRVPVEQDGTPKPNAQRNFTDSDSRIMMRDGAAVRRTTRRSSSMHSPRSSSLRR